MLFKSVTCAKYELINWGKFQYLSIYNILTIYCFQRKMTSPVAATLTPTTWTPSNYCSRELKNERQEGIYVNTFPKLIGKLGVKNNNFESYIVAA